MKQPPANPAPRSPGPARDQPPVANWVAPLALAISMALWGSTHPLVKLTLLEMEAPRVIFLRVLSAAIMLVVLTVLSGKVHLLLAQLRAPLPPLVQGVLGYSLTMNMSTYALQYVPAAVNALLINLSPIFTVFIGAAMLGESLTRRALLGAAIGSVGVARVTLSGQDRGGLGHEGLPGVGIGLTAAAIWALYTVALRKLAHRTIDPLASTTLAALGACIPLAILANPILALEQLWSASLTAQVAILWSGSIATGGTFVVWAWALARMRASQVAAFQYLVPPIALLLAWPMLGETPSVLLVGGMALALAGVGFAQRR